MLTRTDSEIYGAQQRAALLSTCRANLARLRARWSDPLILPNDTAHETRHPELAYHKVEPGCWRFLDIHGYEDGHGYPGVGPFYQSKAELLADLERYYSEVYARVSAGEGA